MYQTYFTKLDQVARTVAPGDAVDVFMQGYCHAPVEELTATRTAVAPWVSLLPTLVHLAAGYQEPVFQRLAEYCVTQYRLPTEAAAHTVLNAMHAVQDVFAEQTPFTANWSALRQLIVAHIGVDPDVTGEFSCD